jgi:hypothetical protein
MAIHSQARTGRDRPNFSKHKSYELSSSSGPTYVFNPSEVSIELKVVDPETMRGTFRGEHTGLMLAADSHNNIKVIGWDNSVKSGSIRFATIVIGNVVATVNGKSVLGIGLTLVQQAIDNSRKPCTIEFKKPSAFAEVREEMFKGVFPNLKLGLVLEEDSKGRAVVISWSSVTAESVNPTVKCGMYVVSVNGKSMRGMDFDNIMDYVIEASVPRTIWFAKPTSIPGGKSPNTNATSALAHHKYGVVSSQGSGSQKRVVPLPAGGVYRDRVDAWGNKVKNPTEYVPPPPPEHGTFFTNVKNCEMDSVDCFTCCQIFLFIAGAIFLFIYLGTMKDGALLYVACVLMGVPLLVAFAMIGLPWISHNSTCGHSRW